jgi:hypothetical protein
MPIQVRAPLGANASPLIDLTRRVAALEARLRVQSTQACQPASVYPIPTANTWTPFPSDTPTAGINVTNTITATVGASGQALVQFGCYCGSGSDGFSSMGFTIDGLPAGDGSGLQYNTICEGVSSQLVVSIWGGGLMNDAIAMEDTGQHFLPGSTHTFELWFNASGTSSEFSFNFPVMIVTTL